MLPRRPPIYSTPHRVPQGFFDGVQNCDPPPPQHCRHSFAPPWGSCPHTLLACLSQLFSGSQPNADEPTELQQRPGPSTSPRCRPSIVEVPALDDKKVHLVWDVFCMAGVSIFICRHYMLLGGHGRNQPATMQNASRALNGGLVLCCSSAVCCCPPKAIINGVRA
jgi:hypothetical protein